MEIIIFVVLILVIGFFFIIKRNKPQSDQLEELPYFKNSNLLTPAELSFFHVLKIAISNQYDISMKVRLADVISVHKATNKTEWFKAFNRIQSKHIDFVLSDKQTSEILCAIELDDQSHARTSRIKRDAFLEKVLSVAELPLLRFDVTQAYQSDHISQKIQTAINPESLVIDSEVEASTVNILLDTDSVLSEEHESKTRKCPSCGALLVQRKSKRGRNAGKIFWGCSNYPQCRHIEDY